MNNESNNTNGSVFQKLEYDDALDIMQNYGYSSASIHPYIYQNGDDLGICYTYVDADYGTLERIKLFETAESLEEYLKQMKWLETNGPLYHVRMALDNYETVYPRILFLRNERIMVPSEMEDIETYDYNLSKRASLDDTTKILYEAGDLLLVYDELKARQLAYIKNLTVLKNTLRNKYYELQLEVDKYNRIGKIERHVTLVPEITDTGIDITLEINIKDRYNQFLAQRPSFEEAVVLIKDAWNMCKALELNSKYYEVQIEDNNTRNEIKLVEAKLALMKDLNDDVKPLFGVDLVSKFRKINKEFLGKNNEISTDFINSQLALVDKKYSVFDQLELFDVSEYLKEAISNSNFDDLIRKYAKGRVKSNESIVRLPLNEVASNLTVQFKEKLSQQEQSVLVLHNNVKFRQLFDAILNTPDYETLPIKKVIKSIKKVHGFNKLKSECYDILKKKLEDPINANVKASLFSNFDFSSFENYIGSLVKELSILKSINGKMVLNSDVNMYSVVKNPSELNNKQFTFVTNDINSMYIEAQTNKKLIALILVKNNTPVLYSPYTFDLGDLYSRNANQQVFIKENIGFDLLIDNSDLNIHVDDIRVNVVNYESEKEISQNLTTATALNTVYKTTFCKLVFRNNAEVAVSQTQTSVETSPVAEVVPVQTAIPVPDVTPVQQEVVNTPVVPGVKEEPKVETPEAKEEKVEEPKEAKQPEIPTVKLDEQKPIAPQKIENPDNKEDKPTKVDVKDETTKDEKKPVEKVEKEVEETKEDKQPEVPTVKLDEQKPIVPQKVENKPVVKTEEVKKEVVPNKPVENKEAPKQDAKPIQQVSKPVQPAKPVEQKVEDKPVVKPDEVKKEVVTNKSVENKEAPKQDVKPVQQVNKPVQPVKPVEQKVENKPVVKTEDVKKEVVPNKPVENKEAPKQDVKPIQQVNKPVQPTNQVEQKVENKPIVKLDEAKKEVVQSKPVENKEVPKQVVKPVQQVSKPVEQKVENKPVVKPDEVKKEVVSNKPVENKEAPKQDAKPIQQVSKPVQPTKPIEQKVENKPVVKPDEAKKEVVPNKPVENKETSKQDVKPVQPVSKPVQQVSKPVEQKTSTAQPKVEVKEKEEKKDETTI